MEEERDRKTDKFECIMLDNKSAQKNRNRQYGFIYHFSHARNRLLLFLYPIKVLMTFITFAGTCSMLPLFLPLPVYCISLVISYFYDAPYFVNLPKLRVL